MSTAPKVSVLIAAYNGERYVAEAVGSILGQTFRDLELIVLDDGSTDGTRAILRNFASQDKRIRLVEKENEGLIRTLNRGIAEARGAYIARLDHDDVSTPQRIEKQANFLDSHPDTIGVGCLLQNIRSDGTPMGQARLRHEVLVHAPGAFPPKQQWLYGPTPMIRAEALRRSGGYREKFVAAEDRDLCWRLGEIGKLARLPEALVAHRHHDANMSRVKGRTQVYSALMGDLSAIAAHFRLDDSAVVDSIEIGGDYGPALEGYRRLLAPHYPVDSFLLYFQLRREAWDMPGFPTRDGILKAVLRHVAEKPWRPERLSLFRRAATYLLRKQREAGGHAPST